MPTLFQSLLLAGAFSASLVSAEELRTPTPIKFRGDIKKSDQISGIARCGKLVVICADEKGSFAVLKSDRTDDAYRLADTIPLVQDPDRELDLEGAAFDGESLFLVGSHSIARKDAEKKRSYAQNKERLSRVDDERTRDVVYRIQLDEHGQLTSKDKVKLTKLLERDPILGRFLEIPSKENGIDIEGIAVADKKLYLAFRGPVLRGNYVPVMVLDFDEPEDYELKFVKLDGRGFRDITAVEDGFLLIAGPVGDGDNSFQLCHWNGKDCVEGEGGPGGKVSVLGTLSRTTAHGDEGKPEGLAVFKEDADECSVAVVYDGAADGGPSLFTVKKTW